MRGWLQVSYADQIDQHNGLVNRAEVIKEVDARLARSLAELLAEWVWKSGTVKPDRATWGRSPQAQAEHRAMMAAAGGPAPMRPKPKDQPDP